MEVGTTFAFAGWGGTDSDEEVWRTELAMADLAEPLGFESIWSIEHHFSNYTMVPDVLQFLTYMAGRTTNVKLGSSVVVLPWHDPAGGEQVSVLDHMSKGRFVLGWAGAPARSNTTAFVRTWPRTRHIFRESAEAL
jgi:alkanesulfonate monooxygenase SsuD/methylene tetrahydromethanopterin reductase-like flavin-dependent oxidoreductase (luciferase family)